MSPHSKSGGLRRLVSSCVSSLFAVALVALPLPVGRGAAEQASAGAVEDARRTSPSRRTEGREGAAAGGTLAPADPATRARVADAYGKLPMTFEVNRGQTDAGVRFLSRGQGYTLFLTRAEAVLSLHRGKSTGAAEIAGESAVGARARSARESAAVLRVRPVGGNPAPEVEGVDVQQGRSHYFAGNDSRRWLTNVANYGAVRYASVYPGVDLIYYGNQRQLEYDFRLAPGADPARIELAFEGARGVSLSREGDLLLDTEAGVVRQQRPFVYQEVGGRRREIASAYKLTGDKRVAFELGAYDRGRPLVIDPVLLYSTFLGGNSDESGMGVAVDASGAAYVTGETYSTNFPVTHPTSPNPGINVDAYVIKLNAAGTARVYGTYVGGSSEDYAGSIAVDASGNAYVGGLTISDDFPLTAGALQQSKLGFVDAFVFKLDAAGAALVYSTFLGGAGDDRIYGVAVDAAGSAYVAGRTDSPGIQSVGVPPNTRGGNLAYRSTDGAGNWAEAESGLLGSHVTEFAYDPTSPATVYAGTTQGVFKSTDGGSVWQSLPPLATIPANGLAVSSNGTVYVASFGGLWRSTDGGTTFQLKSLNSSVLLFSSVAVDPSSPLTVYAGSAFEGMFKSTDGGETGAPLPFPGDRDVLDIAIDPVNTSTVYASTTSGLFKTTNGGALWTTIMSGAHVLDLAVNPSAPATVYAATVGGGILKSTNGGANLAAANTGLTITHGGQTFTPRVESLAIDPSNPSVIYAATIGGGVFKSTDGAANWAAVNGGMVNRSITAVALNPSSPSNVLAGAFTGSDGFVGKLSPGGTAAVYFRYLGGVENDEAHDVALDAGGNAYVAGFTASDTFPVVGAFQSAHAGSHDAFVTKVNAAGNALLYSTFLGGGSRDEALGIAVDAGGAAYITGRTGSTNFPLLNAIQGAPLATDAFVTKLNAAGAALVYSTYLGGSSSTEQGNDIAVDAAGNAVVTGVTAANDFPVAGAVQATRGGRNDAFVTKVNAAGTAFLYSTYLGGFFNDQGNAVAVDAAGNAYVVGTTVSPDLPVAAAFQGQKGESNDAFLVKIGDDADLSITKTDSRDPVTINNSLTYTLRVVNAGPSAATGVTVTDTLPAGVNFVSATPSQGTCAQNAGTVTCALGQLAPQAEATVSIDVTPTSVGTLSNTAMVSSDVLDSDASNNTATQNTVVAATPSIAGHVRSPAGDPLAGITVNLSGTLSASTQTDADGFYQFAGLTEGGSYTVAPSSSTLSFNPQSRSFANLTADQTADFVATTCSYTVTPANQSFGAAGGAGEATVTTLQGCPWNAASGSDWITVTSGASGVGSGTVQFTVAATSAPRAGRLTIAGKNFAVYQGFDSCALPGFTLSAYNISGNPTVVRAADLNGDGRPDLVAANGGGLTGGGGLSVSVLLNDGAGNFTASSFNTGQGSLQQGFALGDFNGDVRPDIATVSFHSTQVRIHFNNGSGGFGQSSTDVAFSRPGDTTVGGVKSADLNLDGRADLLVSTPGNSGNVGGVQILLGAAGGGFTQIAAVPSGSLDLLLSVADVNADGKPDLIYGGGGNNSRPVSVRLGDGTGSFGAPVVSAGASVTVNVAVGDFDGDGRADLAASTVVPGPNSTPSNPTFISAVSILSGDGAGGFTLKSSTDAGGTPYITAADFNADAKLDVALVTGGTKVTVLSGDGAGGLGQPVVVDTGGNINHPGAFGIASSDFDGDTRPDLAAADYTRGAFVLRNTCAGGPTISGRVTHVFSTLGLGGVTVSLGGAQTATTQTDEGGNYVFRNLTPGAAYTVTPSKENYRFAPPSASVGSLGGGFRADFVATPITVRFAANHYVVDEFGGSLTVSVTRAGDTSGETSVNYATGGGSASERQDYTPAVGTLRFAPGETTRSFKVILTNDARVEGWELFNLTLSSPSGAILEFPHTVMVEIRDDDSNPGAPNPIDDARFFVRQHYADFLNREPDEAGLNFWAGQITSCGTDAGCIDNKRQNVSAAFFLSVEFQQTGYLVYRAYAAAFGKARVGGRVPLTLQEFLPDTQQIGSGVVVNAPGWEELLEQNKRAYLESFVLRPQFTAAYPLTMMAHEFVDKLNANAGNVLPAFERDALVIDLGSGAKTRAEVLRVVAEDADLVAAERNRAFVLMQYFGYLRRNPYDAPELNLDFGGYDFWLAKLNQFGGDPVAAQMVRSFLVSGEYRERFK